MKSENKLRRGVTSPVAWIGFIVGQVLFALAVQVFTNDFRQLVGFSNYFLVLLLAGFCAGIAFLYVIYVTTREVHARIQDELVEFSDVVKDTIGINVRYVEETFTSDGTGFEDKVYEQLWREVKKSSLYLRVMTVAALGTNIYGGDSGYFFNRPRRITFLADLEEHVLAKAREHGFTYERLYQVDPGAGGNPKVNGLADAHCRKMRAHAAQLVPSYTNGVPLKFGVKFIPTERITGFMVLDQFELILMTSGVDPNNRPYMHSLFIVEGYNSDARELIRRFSNYFDSLYLNLGKDLIS